MRHYRTQPQAASHVSSNDRAGSTVGGGGGGGTDSAISNNVGIVAL
jgi:hypothetical protein